MQAPERPDDETERQAAVERYGVLDTLPEESYDTITALMATVCDAPVALVTLLDHDRNYLKSHHGVPFDESPRAISFCGHAINGSDALFEVEDATRDPRFHDNPLVLEHGVASYAGAVLIDDDGYRLGTLCVFDTRPRKLTDGQRDALLGMAKQVIFLFQRARNERRLRLAQRKLTAHNRELRTFAGVVSHDLKAPINNIAALAGEIESEASAAVSGETRTGLRHLAASSRSLGGYVDGLLEHYLDDDRQRGAPEPVDVAALFEDLDAIIVRDSRIRLRLRCEHEVVHVNRTVLLQILINLVTNAIKYDLSDPAEIEVRIELHRDELVLDVEDHGPGIAEAARVRIFEPFEIAGHIDANGDVGSGLGLATVRHLAVASGGSVSVRSEPGCGSTFTVRLPTSMPHVRAA